MSENQKKLEELARIEGKDLDEILKIATFDSVAAPICTNPGCTYTTTMEPDQSKGYCEVCGTNTVASCLVLSGIL